MSITQRGKRRGRPPAAVARERAEAPPDEVDGAELEETFDDGVLSDRGDGVRVLSRSRPGIRDASSADFPDEPPPGWGES